MTEQDHERAGLTALAALANEVPKERRRVLEGQAPFGPNQHYDAGFAAGLAHALQVVRGAQGGQAVPALQEVAAVIAARTLWYRRAYEEVVAQWSTPEARAETEALLARIQNGEERMCSTEEIFRALDEVDAATGNGQVEG
jgi:hypothetical protein